MSLAIDENMQWIVLGIVALIQESNAFKKKVFWGSKLFCFESVNIFIKVHKKCILEIAGKLGTIYFFENSYKKRHIKMKL